MFAPVYALKQVVGGNSFYSNINALAEPPIVRGIYENEEWDEQGVVTYYTHIDVTELNAYNGQSQEGRQNTINTTKLALLTLNKNAAQLSNNKFRLWVTFIGVPDQIGSAGERLYAKTQWPYNWQSKLLHQYEQELVS